MTTDPSESGQTPNQKFQAWWNAEQQCPEHGMIVKNAALAAWTEAFRRGELELAALRLERDALAQDAKRYRCLRDDGLLDEHVVGYEEYLELEKSEMDTDIYKERCDKSIDMIIDAALGGNPKGDL